MQRSLSERLFTGFLISLLVILGLTGCKSENIKNVYEEAQQKNAALDCIDMDMKMVMDISMNSGDSVIVNTNSNSKISGLKEKKDISMQMNMVYNSVSDEENTNDDSAPETDDIMMNYYYADGYYYTDMLGQKTKYAMSIEEIIKQTESSIQTDNLQVDALEDLTMEKDGNSKILKFTLNPEKATGITDSVQSQLKTLLGNADVKIVIESGSGTITVNKDGYISAQSVKMVCKASAEEQEITLEIDMDITNNNPGQVIEIEKPVDADYTEIK